LRWSRFADGPILVEQLRLIYASMTVSILPMFPAIALLVWTLIHPGNRVGLLTWAAVVSMTNSYSVFNARRSLARGLNARDAQGMARRLVISVGIGGVSWGALAFGALGNTTAAGDIVVIFVLSGILGGSVGLLAPVLPVFIAFSVPLVVLTVAKLWLLGDATYSVFGVISLMYLGVLIAQTHNSSNATRAAIELRFENLALMREAEQARLEAEQARHEAEEANTAKSKFLAAASHDLRQPIHAQGLFLDVLLHTPLSAQQRELAENISSTSAATADMLDTLLDFSRIEAGVVSPQILPFRMQDLLNKIECEFGVQADAKGLSYRSRETTLLAQSDPALVELITRNLVSNAIRYSDTGGLLVACRRRGDCAVLEVWDTGIGIAPEQQAEVFKEFHQLGNPERDRRKGLGLGLAIAQGLARTLGHTLSLRSAPGRGSVFRLAVPLAHIAPARRFTTGDRLSALVAAGRLRGVHVLVIDDDDVVLSGMAQLLSRWGCEVDTANSIERALVLAQLQAPDLVISDYRLRGLRTGAQAIEALRDLLDVRLPALIITGDTAPERLREALGSGMPLLHKPLSPAALYQALVDLLGRRKTPF
jgi:signal transduction histidine kinase